MRKTRMSWISCIFACRWRYWKDPMSIDETAARDEIAVLVGGKIGLEWSCAGWTWAYLLPYIKASIGYLLPNINPAIGHSGFPMDVWKMNKKMMNFYGRVFLADLRMWNVPWGVRGWKDILDIVLIATLGEMPGKGLSIINQGNLGILGKALVPPKMAVPRLWMTCSTLNAS